MPIPQIAADEAGLSVRTKLNGALAAVQAVFPVREASQAGILAARALAVAAGGGVVILPDAEITLTAPIPADPYIEYVGVMPRMQMGLIPDNPPTFVGGTRLKGDGTFAAFAGNNVAAGTALTQAQGYADSGIEGFRLKDIGFDTFSRAIDIGATNVLGLLYGSLINLWVRNCSDWSVNLINVMHTVIDNIFVFCPSGTTGHVGRIVSDQPTASLIPGNLMATRLFGYQGNANGRGWVFEARAGAVLNEVRVERLQCNRFSSATVTQAATMANGSTSIGVVDGSRFVVGLPVLFSVTANGFTIDRTYVVLSVSGNTITVGDSKSGSAIAATGSAAVNIRSNGMPNVEVVGAASGGILHSSFLHMDLEGYASAQIYTENAGNSEFDVFELNLANGLNSIVARNVVYSRYSSMKEAAVDFDGNSASSHFYGSVLAIRQRKPIGLYQKSDQNRPWWVVAGGLAGANPDFAPVALSGGTIVMPYTALGTKTNANLASTASLDAGRAGILPFTGTAPATWTLPTITSLMLGLTFEIANMGTAALTFNTDGTQLFNAQAGKTSLTLAPGQSVKVIAVQTAGSTYHWATFLSAALP